MSIDYSKITDIFSLLVTGRCRQDEALAALGRLGFEHSTIASAYEAFLRATSPAKAKPAGSATDWMSHDATNIWERVEGHRLPKAMGVGQLRAIGLPVASWAQFLRERATAARHP